MEYHVHIVGMTSSIYKGFPPDTVEIFRRQYWTAINSKNIQYTKTQGIPLRAYFCQMDRCLWAAKFHYADHYVQDVFERIAGQPHYFTIVPPHENVMQFYTEWRKHRDLRSKIFFNEQQFANFVRRFRNCCEVQGFQTSLNNVTPNYHNKSFLPIKWLDSYAKRN